MRHNIRVRWWDREATSYKDAFMGPESARTHIPDDQIEGDHMVEYSHESPPVILGHYWMEGESVPLAPNIACLDYDVPPHLSSKLVWSPIPQTTEVGREEAVFGRADHRVPA